MFRPLIMLLLAGSVALNTLLLHRHLTRVHLPDPVETVWLPPAPVVQVLSFGFDHLTADMLWLQVIQYYGGKVQAKDRNMPNLWPYFDAITTLDPAFEEAYFFGSFLLADDIKRPDLALSLLDRGWRHAQAAASDGQAQPDAWRYPYQMGFVHYFFRNDRREAQRYFQAASEVPGAAPVTGRMAAMLAEDIGEREQAQQLWLEIFRSASDKYTKERAARNLLRLKVNGDLQAIGKAIEGYLQEKKTLPATLDDLVSTGWLMNLPQDPENKPYVYDPQTGKVTGPPVPEY